MSYYSQQWTYSIVRLVFADTDDALEYLHDQDWPVEPRQMIAAANVSLNKMAFSSMKVKR